MLVWLDSSLQKPTRLLNHIFVWWMPTVHYKSKNSDVCYSIKSRVYIVRYFQLKSTAVILSNDNGSHTDAVVSATCVPAALWSCIILHIVDDCPLGVRGEVTDHRLMVCLFIRIAVCRGICPGITWDGRFSPWRRKKCQRSNVKFQLFSAIIKSQERLRKESRGSCTEVNRKNRIPKIPAHIQNTRDYGKSLQGASFLLKSCFFSSSLVQVYQIFLMCKIQLHPLDWKYVLVPYWNYC